MRLFIATIATRHVPAARRASLRSRLVARSANNAALGPDDGVRLRCAVGLDAQFPAARFGAKAALTSVIDGPFSCDHRRIGYSKVQRPIWPLDADAAPRLIVSDRVS